LTNLYLFSAADFSISLYFLGTSLVVEKDQFRKLEERIMALEKKIQAVLSMLMEEGEGEDDDDILPEFEQVETDLSELN
jgi:hypothetical protein